MSAHTTGPSGGAAAGPVVGDGRHSGRALRGDIQGLRAIAVLTVIAAHAGFSAVAGGFVGVDVFFVISGFLISQLLFSEITRSETLSLSGFYARRARRILPAATLVTVATVVASIIWLSVVDAINVTHDAIWAVFFAANIHFASVGTDYFAQEEPPSPLQHYWSLAVEEQFYLVWPLLLLLCLMLVRHAAHRSPRRTARQPLPRITVLAVLVAVTTGSFIYSVVATRHDPVSAYFSTPARAWELGLGAIAALIGPSLAARLSRIVRAVVCVAGLGLIAFACIAYGDGTAFPGSAAAVPVVGSALVLVAGAGGQPDQPWPIRALGVPPMRVVGDWSYSLYLWHWPILIIPEEHRRHALGTPLTLSLIAVTFVFAGLTYRFVETPFRSPLRVPRWRAIGLYPAAVVIVLVVSLGGSWYGRWQAGEFGDNPPITLSNFGVEDEGSYDLDKDPIIALAQASVIAARHHMAVPSQLRPELLSLRQDTPDVGECDYELDVRTLCPHGDSESNRTIVLLGNSHARMWIPAFDKFAAADGYRTYYLVKPNCAAPLVDVGELVPGAPLWQECTDFRSWALDQIDTLHPDLVVVSTSGLNPVFYDDAGQVVPPENHDATTLQGYADLFARLSVEADRTVLIRDVPKSEEEPDTCLTSGHPDLGDCLFKPMTDPAHAADLSVQAADTAGVKVVDPTPWVCWENRCPDVIGDMLPYRDRGHLSTVYAAYLSEELARAIGGLGP